MNLTKSMRQNKADKIFLKLLKRVRSGKTTTKDVKLLMSLHFGKLSEKKKKEIMEKATYVFANKEPMRVHNMEKKHNQKQIQLHAYQQFQLIQVA